MTMIRAWDYWPQPKPNEIHTFSYTDGGPMPDTNAPGPLPPMTSKFVLDDDKKSVLYVDYDENMKWKDTWYLQNRPFYGIAEWRDDNVTTNKLFGCKNKIVFKQDSPIWWGEMCEIGKDYKNFPTSDFFSCWPFQYIKGTQSFNYQTKQDNITLNNGDKYYDVVTCIYQQSWGSKTTGARYWFAKGIGPIAVQWIAINPTDKSIIITNRLEAKYMVDYGTKKDLPAL
jgi:hypothetical protein